MTHSEIRERITAGNLHWRRQGGETDMLRRKTAADGQRPWAIVVACSDARVIPEQIFSAGLGELFVIRVAGNVLDRHQLGSIEYAAAHLHCRTVLLLGHTGCGAVSAALEDGGDGFIQYITDEILLAAGEERDPLRACEKNVEHGLELLRREFADHPEIGEGKLDICGAIYDIETGEVRWL